MKSINPFRHEYLKDTTPENCTAKDDQYLASSQEIIADMKSINPFRHEYLKDTTPENCTAKDDQYLASSQEIIAAFGIAEWAAVGVASLSLAVVIVIFICNLIYVQTQLQKRYKFSTTVGFFVYPGIALPIYLQLFFPRANLVLDLATHLWLALGMLHFFKLTISYFGSETEFVKCLDGKVLTWRVGPCCCWPCVRPCLPSREVHKDQVKLIRILVLQHPFTLGVFAIITLAFYLDGWVETGGLSLTDPYMYINLATVFSFLFALWAFIVIVKSSSRHLLADFQYTGKLVCFQLSIFCVRFQAFVVNAVLLPVGIFTCQKAISSKVYANFLLCTVIMIELVFLSVGASYFFRKSEADRQDYGIKTQDVDDKIRY